jgi:hypothetical protein
MHGFMMQALRRHTLVALWCVVVVMSSVGVAGMQRT